MGKGWGKGFDVVCHVFFLVKKQDKRVPRSVYQGFDTVGAEEGVCVCVVGIYFCEKCVEKCVVRPSRGGFLAHQVNDHWEESEIALRIFLGQGWRAAVGVSGRGCLGEEGRV